MADDGNQQQQPPAEQDLPEVGDDQAAQAGADLGDDDLTQPDDHPYDPGSDPDSDPKPSGGNTGSDAPGAGTPGRLTTADGEEAEAWVPTPGGGEQGAGGQ